MNDLMEVLKAIAGAVIGFFFLGVLISVTLLPMWIMHHFIFN